MTTNDYDRGSTDGANMTVCTIAINNVWGGWTKTGGSVASYEKIGYHAGSLDFIRGVFDSGCPVRKYSVGADGKIHDRLLTDYADLLGVLTLDTVRA